MRKALFLILAVSSLAAAATTATRDLPASYQPGGTIGVTVSVVPSAGTTGVILSETLPTGWSVTSASPAYSTYTVETNTYKWLTFSSGDIAPYSVTYTAQAPQAASGQQVFSGTVTTSGEGVLPVGGDTTVEQGTGTGDIDGDGNVTIADVILCLRMSLGLETPDLAKADLDSDGDVTIADVILLLRLSLGLS